MMSGDGQLTAERCVCCKEHESPIVLQAAYQEKVVPVLPGAEELS